jgi:hypothetical protein
MPSSGPVGSYQRQSAPAEQSIADAFRQEMARQEAGTKIGPCEGCPKADECRHGLACIALELFVNKGRYSAVAPRQPSREIYARLFG